LPSDTLKVSGTDNGTKAAVIKANRDKYSISAMNRALNISRGMVYYIPKNQVNVEVENEVISIYKASRNHFDESCPRHHFYV